ncbi:NAD(P)H:quinone oxidoreductase [Natronogracilivirga saccharolytica]|uniref:NAD(P)H:quinone oxidoreductase n=1 Tax=Natronogracilivirga saccharolytica TaxID=2812953 RepID=A0A8J7UV33_9BACT|nr:NAD(P)H:quinone oxidoreductase [Natronogracilivirga saccharolytica]MBP3192121.1 NAD(P)H:quinone oxidoreductase [Natronogracilivirga saccharolytica]
MSNKDLSGVKLAIIYYSSTGTNYETAKVAASAAEESGAEVRIRKVAELAPEEAIAQNEQWKAHVEATADVPVASNDDLEWADAVLFGTPTRYGNVAAQLKQFIDGTGPLWAEGKLVDKVVAGFTSAQNPHGGQESTLLALYNSMYHWGSIIVPVGYADPANFQAGGNPYGFSITAADPEIDDNKASVIKTLTQRVLNVAASLK